MEFEFDKEIDVLLRKARDSERASAADAQFEHLDADTISAFAENALPERAKRMHTAHLAECARCRQILTNLIALNSEADVEAASSAVAEKTPTPSVPWYRKLFIFPNVAYAMGALVVLFGGFLGFIVLQSLTGSESSVASYQSEKSGTANRPAVVSSSNRANSNAGTTTNTTSFNTAGNTTTTTNAAPALPSASPNIATTTDSAASSSNSSSNATAIMPVPKPTVMSAPQDAEVLADQDRSVTTIQPAPQINQPTTGATAPKDDSRLKEESARSQVENKAEDRQDMKAAPQKKSLELAKSRQKKDATSGETRSVGGKTFNNVGGIWFDTAYSNQKQKTVSRGTSEYQKLDSGVRSISEALGGTVVVVWKGKAYRIQ